MGPGEYQEQLQAAKKAVIEALGIHKRLMPHVVAVLGTGWGSALRWDTPPRSVPFREIPGFAELAMLEGHARCFVYGKIEGYRVLALQGRVHLNESLSSPTARRMVRLQMDIPFSLGVKRCVLTAAAGRLDPAISVSSVMVVDGFVSLFAPDMPLFTGEFVSADDTLSQRFMERAQAAASIAPGGVKIGSYAMLRGPGFEGRKYDKQILRAVGAQVVGMSLLPEAYIAAVHRVEVAALAFVSNDELEEHSHEKNQKRAKSEAKRLAQILTHLIPALAVLSPERC